jgi:hypothetical protein
MVPAWDAVRHAATGGTYGTVSEAIAMLITLSRARGIPAYLITADDGRDILVQLDWDYPGIAGTFGWSSVLADPNNPCDHYGTDGTITCPDCGTTAGTFIASAADYLDAHDGATAEDPGYFPDPEPDPFVISPIGTIRGDDEYYGR